MATTQLLRLTWIVLGVGCWLVLAGGVHAQDATPEDEGFIDRSILYSETVSATISAESVFDFWRFYGLEGDVVVVRMTARDGLAPLVGIANPRQGMDVIARSDENPDGSRTDAAPNASVILTYTLPETGEFVINATRVGTVDGQTTGGYTLTLALESASGTGGGPQDVTFLCGQHEVTTAATFSLAEDRQYSGVYRLSVFGLDGFRPVVRAEAEGADGPLCSAEGPALAGARYALPGEAEVVLPEDEPEYVAQLVVNEVGGAGALIVTVGSIDGESGRFLLLIEGLSLRPADDIDRILARFGPLAAAAPEPPEMLVYLIRAANARLDLFLETQLDDDSPVVVCDDAGYRDCEALHPAADFAIRLADGVVAEGGRLDTGTRFTKRDTTPVTLTVSSRSGRAEGVYYLVALGALPERTTP